jgi:6-phosphogluconate dehydrogenase
MQLGMIGLGRMGASMVRRLVRQGHACVVHDLQAAAVAASVRDGATGAASIAELASKLQKPRAIWLMVPAAVVDATLTQLVAHLEPGDIVIDGGNSYYRDDLRRAGELRAAGLHYVDVGTSGGVAGETRGYCLMIGGEPEVFERLKPIFAALAPGVDAASRTPGRSGAATAPSRAICTRGRRSLRDGPQRYRYGLMAPMPSLNILKNADVGRRVRAADAETTPLRHPDFYRYEFDLAGIAEVWRRGSVIASWLLDLTAGALVKDPELRSYDGLVSDSGEGRWTLTAAIDEAVPAHVLAAALFERFDSRGEAAFADRVLSAMRHAFGGHVEKPAEGAP